MDLSITEAAARLRFSYARTRDFVLRGKLSGQMLDGRWRISTASVDAMIAARAEPPKPATRVEPSAPAATS
ncbi:MAG: helix-turn-helix domain-containing protein [Gemmatimonadales bacterium]|nr:helix-turn-helix domain-containing protein [Gemmatimonadales bacterium]